MLAPTDVHIDGAIGNYAAGYTQGTPAQADDTAFVGEPRRLAIFDFDGTLFRAPLEPAWWRESHGAWHDDPKSLRPPVVADVAPPSLWVGATVQAFRAERDTEGTLTLVMTGRMRILFEDRLRQLLAQAKVFPNKVRLAESGDTNRWKLEQLAKLLAEYPQIHTVEAWDDNPKMLEAFREFVLDRSCEFVGHLVKSKRPMALLAPPIITASHSMDPNTATPATVELISAAKRKSLSKSQFALPELRKYPIHDAAHVRNAAARLEQNKDRLSPSQYSRAKSAISKAAKSFGIKSEYNKEPDGKAAPAGARRHLRMRIGADGSMQVSQTHHLKDGGMFMWAAIELSDKGSEKPVWVQLAKAGTFKGHRSGAFTLDSRTFTEIVANFNATENKQIPIDFEHATEADPAEGQIAVNGAPAQGWIKALDIRAGGTELWGLVEWGDKAREYIKAGQYKFFSPAIRFNSKDRVSGKPVGARMTSGALTNNPFLDGMMPLAARDFAERPTTDAEDESGWVWLDAEVEQGDPTLELTDMLAYRLDEMMPAIRGALAMDEIANTDEMRARCSRLRCMYDAAGSAHGCSNGVDLGKVTTALRDLLKTPVTSSVYDMLDQLDDLLDAIDPEEDDHLSDGGDAALAAEPVDPALTTATDAPAPDAPASPPDTQSEPVAIPAPAEPPAVMATNEEVPQMETISLTEHQSKLDAAVGDMTLKLKSAESRAEAAETELKTLREAETNRQKQDREARVQRVLSTYGKKQNLTDSHIPMLLSYLERDPEGFDKLYPDVQPQVAALTTRITPSEQPLEENPPKNLPQKDLMARAKEIEIQLLKDGVAEDVAWARAVTMAHGEKKDPARPMRLVVG